MKETELAQHFVEYLSDMYDLYFEVFNMDIVGKCKSGGGVISVEVKKFLNFKVIEQAHRNMRSCHYSYIAVPRSSADNNPFGLKVCENLGIGALIYNDKGLIIHNDRLGGSLGVYEKVKPQFNRKAFVKYAKNLNSNSAFKKTTPGAKSGETATCFSITIERLEQYVRRNDGCLIKDALNNIEHHYGCVSSARSCIVKYIDTGVIKTIRRDGSKLYIEKK